MIVPLLILWLGYGEREATGTSLAAIVVIAAAGALVHGAYGNVDVAKGCLIGVPAAVGGGGAARPCSSGSPSAPSSAAFAALLLASAVVLVA